MRNLRIYGKGPYRLVLVHGGPGVPGYLKPMAEELGKSFGVVEPFQTKETLMGQVKELKKILDKKADIPIVVVGHSWGAWLSMFLASEYPEYVRKLILIAPGPLEESYANEITKERINRLTIPERKRLYDLQKDWAFVSTEEKKHIFKETGLLISKADAFDPVEEEDYTVEYQPEIFRNVWAEASALRKSGKLVDISKTLRCPVVLIHGDYDPHPWKGAKEPLEKQVPNFTFYLLEKCGHEPWNERHAKTEFYQILIKEVAASS